MPLPHTTQVVKLQLEWNATGKRWRLTWSLIDEHRKTWSTHWKWVETSNELDVLDAFRVADAVCREMEAWLPL
jgi:hypothetical protein